MPKPTPRVLALQKQFFDQYKKNKNSWVKKYGADAEKIMTGAAFKRAKSAAMKENKQRIKEMVKKALMGPIKEEETVDPVDIATLDIPLLIRIMEFAKEDAQTDMDLHNVAEKLIEFGKDGEVMTMDNYDAIVDEDSFTKDLVLVVDALRASVYRQFGFEHHLHEFIEKNISIIAKEEMADWENMTDEQWQEKLKEYVEKKERLDKDTEK